ncbi:hypothetical protein VCRA2123O443_410001 [Vibrio crassostreae]|nr:hypothetical protein VCRA2111O408_390001 [Vibrio crassostreae]CAK2350090.1 hypothetical protein VCRA211O406_380003 [Vibrio crassostreae]CAK3384677.1 hypothetical protein VCRA2123O443_410001 [Vibrio crassostreae]
MRVLHVSEDDGFKAKSFPKTAKERGRESLFIILARIKKVHRGFPGKAAFIFKKK